MPTPRRIASLLCVTLLAGCIPGNRPDPAPPVGTAPRPSMPTTTVPPATTPDALPAWVARAVVADAVDVPASVYTVRPGDSLRAISAKTGAGSEAIARENALRAPFVIVPGQKLRIPGGRYHHVKPGETGIAIARAYGVDWSRVATVNALEEPYILRTGQRLLLPSTQEVAKMSLEQRASAFRIDIDDLITGGEPALAQNQPVAKPVVSPKRTLPSTAAVGEPRNFTGRFDWPVRGKILSRFGPAPGGRRNDGINIAAARGAPILASADGVVAYAGTEIAVYGGLILLRHGDGWITAYAHAEDLLVKRGQAVKRGQLIGRAGATGSAREPQLHFEIRSKRSPVDPLAHLPSS